MKKILRKKLSARDENRHLDIKREVNFRMSGLIDRYWEQYASKKKSQDREKSILEGIRDELGQLFVREVDGAGVQSWYQGLTETKGLSAGTAVRHFNVMHHMMAKAATIWSKDTGIDRNPADAVEVKRPDDQRDRHLNTEEIEGMKAALDEKMYRKAGKGINQTFFRLRLIVLIALTTGMRKAEIFGLNWSDLLYREELIAVRAKLKGGKMRYVPMPAELALEFKRYPAVFGEDRIFPPEPGTKRERQRVDKSFETILEMAGIKDFRFHDLRHTFASWYMMNGGDLYELAKILGHSNIKMTERYAKLAKSHIAKTGSTAREMWRLMEGKKPEQLQGTV
ncbi:MAG: site-specific integrase [Acidobacteriia bacterium]|nr:site-specific integrase [Terriglobia bacterium]